MEYFPIFVITLQSGRSFRCEGERKNRMHATATIQFVCLFRPTSPPVEEDPRHEISNIYNILTYERSSQYQRTQ